MIVNTRSDLEVISGTAEYLSTMTALKASMTTRIDATVYPDGYGQSGYNGDHIEPVWQEIESLETIERLGFKKNEFLALCASAGV